MIGDVTIILGYGATRVATLRDDILGEFDRQADGCLPLPPGESESTVRGTEPANAPSFALAVPVGLQAVFGGR